MEIKDITGLIAQIDQSSLKYFEFHNDGLSLVLSKNDQVIAQAPVETTSTVEKTAPVAPVTPEATSVVTPTVNTVEKAEEGTIIRSQLVGVVYLQPAPDQQPFVSVGDVVSEGQTLCIIEAMKLMNEVPSTISGKVVEVLVNNGEIVDYDAPLFRVV